MIDMPCPFCEFAELSNQNWWVMWEPRYKGDVENPRGGIVRNFKKPLIEW